MYLEDYEKNGVDMTKFKTPEKIKDVEVAKAKYLVYMKSNFDFWYPYEMVEVEIPDGCVAITGWNELNEDEY
jgi:hypothetical protein